MDDLEILLRCTSCRAYRSFDRRDEAKRVVRCAECGKRHSVDSLYAVDPTAVPTYEESH